MLEKYERPLFIFGAGVQGCRQEAVELVHSVKVPAVCTWGAADLFRHDDPYYFGTFGTHGVRYANFAVQNADLIVSLGSRLDTKATGSPVSAFAPKARIVMVDIDQTEIDKFDRLDREIWKPMCMDVKGFWYDPLRYLFGNCRPWLNQLSAWKARYPAVPAGSRHDTARDYVNPYLFVDELSDYLKPSDVIVSDTGCALAWMMQAFRFTGQRFIHAFNQTPMGYGLPAAVGAAFATKGRVILVTGDGGLAVNIGELATLHRHSLPVKMILFNNQGHAMCRQTQRQWLGGEYPATSYEGGLAAPDFRGIARAFGLQIRYYPHIGRLLECEGPALMELNIDPNQGVEPQVKFGGKLEEGEPLLPKEELEEIMA